MEKAKHEEKKRKDPKLPFWGIYHKNKKICFFVQGHSSWSAFGFHLVRGPKVF